RIIGTATGRSLAAWRWSWALTAGVAPVPALRLRSLGTFTSRIGEGARASGRRISGCTSLLWTTPRASSRHHGDGGSPRCWARAACRGAVQALEGWHPYRVFCRQNRRNAPAPAVAPPHPT